MTLAIGTDSARVTRRLVIANIEQIKAAGLGQGSVGFGAVPALAFERRSLSIGGADREPSAPFLIPSSAHNSDQIGRTRDGAARGDKPGRFEDLTACTHTHIDLDHKIRALEGPLIMAPIFRI